MKAEFQVKLEDQRQEMDLRLDAQRRHLVQRETALQCQIDELRSNNMQLNEVTSSVKKKSNKFDKPWCVFQTVQTLLNLEKEHRLDLERMQVENRKLNIFKQMWQEKINKRQQDIRPFEKISHMKPKVTEL